MKKILFLISIIIIIITISIKVNYRAHISLSFGNNIKSNYIYYYDDTRFKDIISDIEKNIKLNNRHIQNILVRADNIYLDLNNIEVTKNDIYDLNNLLAYLRSFTKENIIIILKKEEYSSNNLINNWIFKIKNKYDIMIKR